MAAATLSDRYLTGRSCRTRPSTSWTRPHRSFGSRSIRCPPRSTLSSADPAARDGAGGPGQGDRSASADASGELEAELADLQEQSAGMKAHWQNEKDAILRIQTLKEELEGSTATSSGSRTWRRRPSCGTAASRDREAGRRHRPPWLGFKPRRRCSRKRSTRKTSPRSSAAGPAFPVSRLIEAESRKLLRLEEELHQRVIGQDEPVARCRRPFAAAGPGCPIPTDRSAASCSWARPGLARPSWLGPWPTSCSTTSGP